EDIALADKLLGRVLAIEHEDDVSAIARQLYREALTAITNDADGTSAAPTKIDTDGLLGRYPALRHPPTMRKVLRAFTVFFQMVNVAEQKEIVRANRKRQATRSTQRPESIVQAVAKLKADGKTAAQVQEMLDRVEICPTITAHP